MKVSYSYGSMDLLHFGHLNAVTKAKNGADLHVFGLMTDSTVKKWMGVLVSSYEERKAVLEALECIDLVMQQDSFDPTNNLKKLHEEYPDAEITLFHRADWKALPADAYVESIGGRVAPTDYYERLTPENILKILSGEQESVTDIARNDLISTKANTLFALRPLVKKSEIEPIEIVLGKEFLADTQTVSRRIVDRFFGKKIVVRSSSSNEDCYEQSNAGHFLSILGVNSANAEEVTDAIEQVFASYGMEHGALLEEQVLIQTQTPEVRVSGVVFTRDIKQNRPYYVINYDDTGSTDSVTSGAGGKTISVSRDVLPNTLEEPWSRLMEAVQELESLLNGITLDIEFAVTSDNRVVIFQVRPLAANYRFKRTANDEDYQNLKRAAKEDYLAIPNHAGASSMKLSDMAFWNPAEMIGSDPRPLDYSLYRHIITKSAWNEGLLPLGYQQVNEELMYKVGNKPYISLDYSFKALTPARLDEKLTDKLLEYYRNKLEQNLTAHDKIEFEIVFNCFDFSTLARLQDLLDAGFGSDEVTELGQALHELTENALRGYFNVLEQDLASLERLEEVRTRIGENRHFMKQDHRMLSARFKELVAAIAQYGTPQFSRQARYAFIANALCCSLVENGYWTEADRESFSSSLMTVAKELELDMAKFRAGKMSRSEFNHLYGHLRSGTYDIRQDRYEKLEFSQNTSADVVEEYSDVEYIPAEPVLRGAANALKDAGFSITADEFIIFLKKAMEQREKFKFEFTKALSDALELLVNLGECLGISKERMSYLQIEDILASEYYGSRDAVAKFFDTIIQQRKADYKRKSALLLPDVIWTGQDLDVVRIGEARPNFVTNKQIEGEVCVIDMNTKPEEICGKIVIIEKADPGYDWIFSQNIKGLITKYGGVASHMAIRCAEFNLPAAIGCGEKIYEFATGVQRLVLDCANGKLLKRG